MKNFSYLSLLTFSIVFLGCSFVDSNKGECDSFDGSIVFLNQTAPDVIIESFVGVGSETQKAGFEERNQHKFSNKNCVDFISFTITAKRESTQGGLSIFDIKTFALPLPMVRDKFITVNLNPERLVVFDEVGEFILGFGL